MSIQWQHGLKKWFLAAVCLTALLNAWFLFHELKSGAELNVLAHDGLVGAHGSLIVSPEAACACSFIEDHHKCPEKACHLPWEDNGTASVTVKALQGSSILFVGDSLSWQVSQALHCYVHPSANISVSFESMPLFPFDLEEFEQHLDSFVAKKQPTAIVFGIGTWYNWDWSEEYNLTYVTPQTTGDIMRALCEESLSVDLKNESSLYQRALVTRKRCGHLLRRDSYQSGLMRLAFLVRKNRARWPHVIWKDVPPQHWGTISGNFDGIGDSHGCMPVQSRRTANARNKVADLVLTGIVDITKTWNQDINHHDLHPVNDCTHYCNPSPVTWGWVTAVLDELHLVQTGKVSEGEKLSVLRPETRRVQGYAANG